jgi:Phage portal protein
VTRLYDRLLARQAGYNEYLYSGAYQVSTLDSQGRSREAANAGIVRHAREAYEASGVVYACAAVRQAVLAEARFKLQSLVDMRLYGDVSLSLLEHPWPNADTGELLARMDQDDTTAGNSYIRRAEPADGADPLLVQMRPECVTIISEERRDHLGRVFKVPSGYLEDVRPLGVDRDPQEFTPDEVAHYSPGPDARGYFRGMSWLTPVLSEVRADLTVTSYKTIHLANGAMPGIVIKYSRKLSDSTVDTLAKRLTGKHAGPENAGKVWILDEGADMTVAGSTLEQLQVDALAKASERRICAAAGPGLDVILGFAQGDYQAAVRRLADLWARPHWRMACAVLQHLVDNVPDAGVRLWYDVSGIAALREGELQRGQTTLVKAQAVQSFVMAGYTRESSMAAADSGDIMQLKPAPEAPPPGVSGRETATEKLGPGGQVLPGIAPGVRPPQAGRPEALPGVVKPNLPNARPGQFQPVPSMPNGARG